VVPVVDGVPRWPWDEVVARRRLGQVAKLAGLRLTGGEVFVESGSNDTWFLSGETVLQVCYRGDVDRLVRAAELLAVLPDGVPGPAVLDHGRDRLMSWMVVKRVHAGSLWRAWRSETGAVLRRGGPARRARRASTWPQRGWPQEDPGWPGVFDAQMLRGRDRPRRHRARRTGR
jgi:hypothetical protein